MKNRNYKGLKVLCWGHGPLAIQLPQVSDSVPSWPSCLLYYFRSEKNRQINKPEGADNVSIPIPYIHRNNNDIIIMLLCQVYASETCKQ